MIFRPYDRLEAVIYAHRWAYGRNPAFYDYEEHGRGLHQLRVPVHLRRHRRIMNFTPTYGWYYIRRRTTRHPAWTGVVYLRNFLVRPERSPGPVAAR